MVQSLLDGPEPAWVIFAVSRFIESLITSKIILSTIGGGPCNLVSSLAAFQTGCFTFNKSVVSLFDGTTPLPCCLKDVSSSSLHFYCSYIHGTFVIPRGCFSSFQSLVTDFEGRSLLSKAAKALHFSISLTSVLVDASWSSLEEFGDLFSSNAGITCKAYIAHFYQPFIDQSSNFFNVIFVTWSFR